MISSGMKRGLAATAISALAVTGIPALAGTASANSMAEQATANQVVLHAPADAGFASIKNDGVNTTVHLVANGGANVNQVMFEYSDGTNWHTIATVSRNNGVFSTEWTPPAAQYNVATAIRATGLTTLGTPIASPDTNTATVSPTAESIDIANAAGSNDGVFVQPYATVTAPRASAATKSLGSANGTTSDVASNPTITVNSPSGTGATTNEDVAGTVNTGDTTRTWSAPVDFSGYTWDADATDGTVDQALIYAKAQGDDAEAVNVYKQTITTVTATAAKPTVPASGTSDITVKVLDQNGKPVVGAEVMQDDNTDTTGDAAPKYTNSQGEAVFPTQSSSSTGTTHTFFVNTTDNAAYENGTDFKRTATVTSYSPAAASITPKSTDGAAFDDDEYAGGDITATVKDQNGNAMAGQVVRYSWTVTPFDTTTGYPKTLAEQSATTDGSGVATIVFPTSEPSGTYVLHTYVNQDGTPGQQSGDLGGTDLTVKAGQAEVTWADGTKAQAPAGTTKTFTGSLVLEDGTGLPARNLAFSWTKNVTGNAVVAAQSAQPTGTTRTSDTAASGVTGNDGSFGVALSDPSANPNVNELNGSLVANAASVGDSSTLTVDFLRSAGPVDANDISVNTDDLFGDATPGRPVDLDISVENADGDTLTDFPVTVSVNHGFLSPNAENSDDLTPDPAAAEGGQYGEWKSDGTSKSFTTDDSGDTGTVVAIEKDAGFDTSDTVTTTVTIKAGTVTKTVTLDFESIDPLNGGSVSIERAAAAQQTVTILPKAPTAESVNYNVFTTDQFGNLVDDMPVDLTDDLAKAYVNGDDNNGFAWSQLKNDGPALELDSDVAGDQTVTGSWDAPTTTWTDGQPLVAGFQEETLGGNDSTDSDSKKLTDTGETVNWYVIDFAHSTYTMTHDTADTVPVGTTVLETYKAVDQNSEPIRNVTVKFFRSGPDAYQDGDFNSASTTNEDGEASYVFAGAKAGTATVQGLITDFSSQGGDQTVPESRATDTVSFADKQATIHPGISAKHIPATDSIAGYDLITITAHAAGDDAVVKLFRVKDGVAKRVKSKVLGADGVAKFKRADLNGDKANYYYATVSATSTNKAGKTDTITVK